MSRRRDRSGAPHPDLPEGAPLRREDRDLPRSFWRLALLGLLALCLLHVAGLAWACWSGKTLIPVVQAATGQDNLTTDLVGAVLIAVTWVTKRQGNRTEALAGRGAAGLHAKVDAVADAHLSTEERLEQLTTAVEEVVAVFRVVAGSSPTTTGTHRATTGVLPRVEPEPAPAPAATSPTPATLSHADPADWEFIVFGNDEP